MRTLLTILCFSLSYNLQAQLIGIDPSFGDNGIVKLEHFLFGGINIDPKDNIFLGGSNNPGPAGSTDSWSAFMEKRDSDGNLIQEFGNSGAFSTYFQRHSRVRDIIWDSSGNSYAFGFSLPNLASTGWVQFKVDSIGNIDDSYLMGTFPKGSDTIHSLNDQHVFNDGKAVLLVDNSLLFLDTNGEIINEIISNSTIYQFELHNEELYVLGKNSINKYNLEGNLQDSILLDTSGVYTRILLDKNNNFMLTDSRNINMIRIGVDGTLDNTFNLDTAQIGENFRTGFNAVDLSCQFDNYYLLTGRSKINGLALICRLNYDGTVDSLFGANGYLQLEGYPQVNIDTNAEGNIYAVYRSKTGQGFDPDKILVKYFPNPGIAFQSNSLQGIVNLNYGQGNCDTLTSSLSMLVEAKNDSTSLRTVLNMTGKYKFYIGGGDYEITPVNLPEYYESMPEQYTVSVDTSEILTDLDFCLEPKEEKRDLSISTYPLSEARPGFPLKYKLIYGNKGTILDSANVQLSFEHNKIEFVSSDQNVTIEQDSLLTLQFEQLHPFETKEVNIEFYVKPNEELLGENLKFIGEVFPVEEDCDIDDNRSENNMIIIGSYDPNDIRVVEGPFVYVENKNNYLHYIIRFENTGTASAKNIQVINSLESNLDWDSFELERMSHDGYVEVRDKNQLRFTFENINLPHSEESPDDAKGFIMYKIKPKSDIELYDVIRNQADIYFDFNSPIITNEISTQIIKDNDRDGYTSLLDCDDENPLINPGAAEILYNGIDENCDGYDELSCLSIPSSSPVEMNFTQCQIQAPLPQIFDNSSFVKLNVNPVLGYYFGICQNYNEQVFHSIISVFEFNNSGSITGNLLATKLGCEIMVFHPEVSTEFPDLLFVVNDLNNCRSESSGIVNGEIDAWCSLVNIDQDGDGFGFKQDCDDLDITINPDAVEIEGNGIDENCDGEDTVISSIADTDRTTFSIFPNPAKNEVYIESQNDIQSITVYSISLQEKFIVQDNGIDISSLKDGMYIVKVQFENGDVGIKKLLVSNF